ncbi:hypothetical protein [Luteimonas lutimaris]|uniref:hypothetical protein n=1 Tax=Luteimonas lutimaris TaxID=698645 RepID=UPI0031E0051A
MAATLPASAAAGDCPDGVVESLRVSDAFGEIPPPDYPMNVVAETCKVWPYDTDRLLVAVAYSNDESFGNRSVQVRVAMLDARDQRLLAGYVMDKEEDAGFELSKEGLALDTARYDLAPGVRAFGVVVDNEAHNGCPDYSYDRELTLLVVDGTNLRPVLRQDLFAWMRVEGEPCSMSMGKVVTDNANVFLAMAGESHAGYRDMRLTAKITRYTNEPDRDGTERTRSEHRLLRYDGRRYRPVGDDDVFWLGPPGSPEWRDVQ